jgi:hypothetical protein
MRALVVLLLVALATPARAQSADVPGLIKLIENQPSDMDRSTWKEKRRDAARKLAQSKDKRAVPVLIDLAETETFDIIGDIAIEGLGTLKDRAAVPVLQRIVGDASRDKSSRDLARKSLGKLGAADTAAGGSATGGTTGGTAGGGATAGAKTGGGATVTTGGTTTTGSAKAGAGANGATRTGAGGTAAGPSGTGSGAIAGGASGGGASGAAATDGETGLSGGGSLGGHSGGALLGGERSASDVEGLPALDDDVIAAYDRLTFAAGTAGFSYDTARSRVDFDINAAGRYQKRVEAETRAFGLDLGADLVAGAVNPEGRGVSRGVVLNVHGDGEARFYSDQLYGIGKAAVGIGFTQFSFRHPTAPGQDQVGGDARALTADFQIALGGGYGRIVDVGAAIRVQRLAQMLDDARALGKPIDAATARRLQLTWWALRGERSTFRSLIATVAILREAGILLGEPNAVITYEILTVLRDTQLYLRPSGFDVQLLFGEGYLYRPDSNDDGTCDLGAHRCGRVEQVLVNAGYGKQVDDNQLELSGNAYARYRLFTPDGNPAPWAAGAFAGMRRFIYGEHGDPFGALDLRGGIMVSADDSQQDPCTGFGCDKSLRIEAELGFTYWLNQASGLRLAAHVAQDAGEVFIGARLEATYGLLDGTFAR